MPRFGLPLLIALALSAACSRPVPAGDRASPPPAREDAPASDLGAFRVFRGDGRPAALSAVLEEMAVADVMVLTEEPGDSIARRIEALLTAEAPRRSGGRPVFASGGSEERIADRPDAFILHVVRGVAAAPPDAIDAHRRIRPGARIALVRLRPAADPAELDPGALDALGSADFVILTRR